MAGRGKGSAGRGRGRGSLSFSVEQLGFQSGEVLPGPVLQPPLLFPPPEFRPAPLETNTIYNQQLMFKTEFVEFFNKSVSYIKVTPKKVESSQFIDAEDNVLMTEKPLPYDWSRFPVELKPTEVKRKNKTKVCATKIPRKRSISNINTWLEELEKKETTEDSENVDEEKENKNEKDEENEKEEAEEGEEDDLDEEMDEGTDYNQNYFDNGEGYLDDEDDNLDDGPIY